MSLVQRLAKFVVPRALFVQMRESSERWMIQCTACLSERSVWRLEESGLGPRRLENGLRPSVALATNL
jgi:hypothetical protein